ncbi:MAG: hypothetical protein ACR2PK_07425 [Acidimicrobiales bacterium]
MEPSQPVSRSPGAGGKPSPDTSARPKPRYGTIVKHLTNDPEVATELASKLSDDVLFHVGEAVAQEVRSRAVAAGDQEAVIASAFETGFGRDGLGLLPWVEGSVLVCPGGLVSKGGRSRSAHRCRFVSVNDTWVWESELLITESKRASPGSADGFRAIALIPLVEGAQVDSVAGRLRSGQHQVDHVHSFVVTGGRLVEVSQRSVKSAGMM